MQFGKKRVPASVHGQQVGSVDRGELGLLGLQEGNDSHKYLLLLCNRW
jgi:hypothetical protein